MIHYFAFSSNIVNDNSLVTLIKVVELAKPSTMVVWSESGW